MNLQCSIFGHFIEETNSPNGPILGCINCLNRWDIYGNPMKLIFVESEWTQKEKLRYYRSGVNYRKVEGPKLPSKKIAEIWVSKVASQKQLSKTEREELRIYAKKHPDEFLQGIFGEKY